MLFAAHQYQTVGKEEDEDITQKDSAFHTLSNITSSQVGIFYKYYMAQFESSLSLDPTNWDKYFKRRHRKICAVRTG
ncbi:hypothetical protein DPMN_184118 [Dreissena polymorpha]|uniref:Uncharacterized protein n=1 Tax=Dreissena polymorpha TaxID=45954 RepID=A0A9D4DKA1_DREPO|nr:hypothetical protein DPMN_184118 [Dreissena polymorpha]